MFRATGGKFQLTSMIVYTRNPAMDLTYCMLISSEVGAS